LSRWFAVLLLAALAGCAAERHAADTHECVVTPNNTVECNERQ
jgi:hypothetical protein